MANNGPTPMERFIRGILPENPVYRQVLGTCPTLAVTGNMKAAMTMAAAVMFVLICANIIISLIRNLLKPHLRILIFTLTIAAFVTIADRVLAAYLYKMSKELGPYVPLIIVNCIIICRCEVCAAKQNVVTATFDAVGQSIGFALALATLATVREILGAGTWFGLDLGWGGAAFDNYKWAVMVLPPGAFITFGLLLGAGNWIGEKRSKKAAA